jgi:hypothetical protein
MTHFLSTSAGLAENVFIVSIRWKQYPLGEGGRCKRRRGSYLAKRPCSVNAKESRFTQQFNDLS